MVFIKKNFNNTNQHNGDLKINGKLEVTDDITVDNIKLPPNSVDATAIGTTDVSITKLNNATQGSDDILSTKSTAQTKTGDLTVNNLTVNTTEPILRVTANSGDSKIILNGTNQWLEFQEGKFKLHYDNLNGSNLQIENTSNNAIASFGENRQCTLGNDTNLISGHDINSNNATFAVRLPMHTTGSLSNITDPVLGMIVFNQTNNEFEYYDGTNWVAIHNEHSTSDSGHGVVTVMGLTEAQTFSNKVSSGRFIIDDSVEDYSQLLLTNSNASDANFGITFRSTAAGNGSEEAGISYTSGDPNKLFFFSFNSQNGFIDSTRMNIKSGSIYTINNVDIMTDVVKTNLNNTFTGSNVFNNQLSLPSIKNSGNLTSTFSIINSENIALTSWSNENGHMTHNYDILLPTGRALKINNVDINNTVATLTNKTLDNSCVVANGALERAVIKSISTTVDPTVNNDISEGYQENSLWNNSLTNQHFICSERFTGTAVWNRLIDENTTQNMSNKAITSSTFSGSNVTSGNINLNTNTISSVLGDIILNPNDDILCQKDVNLSSTRRLKINSINVLNEQQPAIADLAASPTNAQIATKINAILSMLRVHGLIAT